MSNYVTINKEILSEVMMESIRTYLVEKSKRKKSKEEFRKRRDQVLSYLKQEGVDNAPYAYALWPGKEKASARSYFYKCRDGKKNRKKGTVYRFTDKQINKLYSMISSNSIN